MAGFDITKQAAAAETEDKGIAVHIFGLDEKPLFHGENGDKPVTITVAGAHSKTFRRVEERLRKRKIKPRQLTGEVIHEDNVYKVAACTLGWDGFYVDAQPIECNLENAKMLYKQCPWVMDQVMEAMNDHASFFESSSLPQQSI